MGRLNFQGTRNCRNGVGRNVGGLKLHTPLRGLGKGFGFRGLGVKGLGFRGLGFKGLGV